MLIDNVYYISTILIGSLGLAYTIIYNSSSFVGHKIIFDIFDEIDKTKELNKLLVKKTMYMIIYIIGLLIFPLLHTINYIISILFWIIIVSGSMILIIAIYQNQYNKKVKNGQKHHNNKQSEIKILNYKVGFILIHVYILLFISILLAFIESLPYITFLSIPLLLFYLSRYFLEILISLEAVILIDEELFMFAVREKYDNINDSLRKTNENLWLTIVLKNGEKISGDLCVLDINFLTLVDIKNIIYNIKYKQIEVIGCKYYPLDANQLKTDDV